MDIEQLETLKELIANSGVEQVMFSLGDIMTLLLIGWMIYRSLSAERNGNKIEKKRSSELLRVESKLETFCHDMEHLLKEEANRQNEYKRNKEEYLQILQKVHTVIRADYEEMKAQWEQIRRNTL